MLYSAGTLLTLFDFSDNYDLQVLCVFFLQVGIGRLCHCTSRCCLCYGEIATKAVQRGILSGQSEHIIVPSKQCLLLF